MSRQGSADCPTVPREATGALSAFVGVMPDFQADYNLRPRKKRHIPVHRPEGYKVVIRLPKDSNKAFRVSIQLLQDALLEYYGQKGAKQGCSSKETGSKPEQEMFSDSSSQCDRI